MTPLALLNAGYLEGLLEGAERRRGAKLSVQPGAILVGPGSSAAEKAVCSVQPNYGKGFYKVEINAAQLPTVSEVGRGPSGEDSEKLARPRASPGEPGACVQGSQAWQPSPKPRRCRAKLR